MMTLQEYNHKLDELLEKGKIKEAFAFQDEYPELTRQSIEAYSWRISAVNACDQLQKFRQLVYERAGKKGSKKLEKYNDHK